MPGWVISSCEYITVKSPDLIRKFIMKGFHIIIPTIIQGHPTDLSLKISALLGNFCWLGDVAEVICTWKGSVACCW